MKVSEFLKKNKRIKLYKGNDQEEVTYISADSRKIISGEIFCVYDSFMDFTLDYIKDAQSKSANTILINKNNKYLNKLKSVENILVSSSDPMQLHGDVASFLLDHPSRKLKIIAVTGTNGKTSLTHILYDMVSKDRKRCGIIGTIQTKYGNKVIQTGYTTPEPSMLQSLLLDMYKDEVEYVFMEASSHGLKLGRMNGVNLYAGIFINLTLDHTDFHPTQEDYLNSKFKLFKLLSKSIYKDAFAVVSIDSQAGKQILNLIKKNNYEFKILTFGKGGTYSGEVESLSLQETVFKLKEGNKTYSMTTNLLGNFNFINVSLAYIICKNLQIDTELLRSAIENLNPVEGRFHVIYSNRRNRIGIVDYAHTPDALENILKSLKAIPHTKLITIFGCGGDRDKSKRPIMGKIANSYSDMVIITSDNPRTENPETIIEEIYQGIPNPSSSVLKVLNRKQAIKKGVNILPEEGILLVAGKGHENYQIIGKTKEDFSDLSELKNAFTADETSRI
ncbi:MAG: UDP-N-acetylmuramoyl-L-alanyl-D-glutamate--2,6-diaminopimelate ligase [Leptospiraceae bacterium]|nr:UDP-N-acetylmuramoyl-L-alanyl-D-glutamate--2,6-diaminopimelate ligase [Leptospiraceae bacterium]MCP5497349.1 UDP-N-acetylmuramoyl-L-alanyl-D-glutamate--2,6-diaminopimelate ligase [Leptospiraceae bacterium]